MISRRTFLKFMAAVGSSCALPLDLLDATLSPPSEELDQKGFEAQLFCDGRFIGNVLEISFSQDTDTIDVTSFSDPEPKFMTVHRAGDVRAKLEPCLENAKARELLIGNLNRTFELRLPNEHRRIEFVAGPRGVEERFDFNRGAIESVTIDARLVHGTGFKIL